MKIPEKFIGKWHQVEQNESDVEFNQSLAGKLLVQSGQLVSIKHFLENDQKGEIFLTRIFST